ncbi:MAG: hypothetical protein QNJ26_01240 [Desulfobacterales bacterium]|nr:hypothetical protein [Desulfobacterales bacterium]
MPTYYEHKRPGVVHCYAVGNYSFEETFNNYQSALNDPNSSNGVHLIMDVRESDETRTAQEMEALADLLANSPTFQGRCAIIVDAEAQVRYGLGRMLSAFGEMRNLEFEVFHDEDAAYSWIENPET